VCMCTRRGAEPPSAYGSDSKSPPEAWGDGYTRPVTIDNGITIIKTN